jgi:emericellamide synthase (highly reducing iterative type I polyketide synthase)
VEGEGYTAENEAAGEFGRRQGLTPYKLEEFLVTIEEAIKNPIATTPTEAQLLCGITRADPSSESKEAAVQRPDPKFSHIWSKATTLQRSTTNSGQVDVQAVLRSCTNTEDAFNMVLDAMKMKLARLLAIPVDEIRIDRSIAGHGMDSLVAVELRNWILTVLEAHVQRFELMSPMPFSELALQIAKRSRLIASEVFAGT